MRRVFYSLCSSILVAVSSLAPIAGAAVYIPTSESSDYLPTVKILSYSLGYDGSLTGDVYGSGTLIDNNGTILTNGHVIENSFDPTQVNDAFQICLTVSNNPTEPVCEFTASLVASHPDIDLAILKMDRTDVSGRSIDLDFYLPYDNSGAPEVGDELTVLGYPDTGGRTITFTRGVVSGFLSEGGVRYIKTDADISFGNSGGTAVDADGNFVGIPTYIFGSTSSEVLGYLIPVDEVVAWIDANRTGTAQDDSVAKAELRSRMLANVRANNTGVYNNAYPDYSIKLIDGWKFGNSLEGSFDASSYGFSTGEDGVVIYRTNAGESDVDYVAVSVTDYGYEVTLEDIEYLLGSYSEDVYLDDLGSGSEYERVLFNGYNAVREDLSYYDWWTGDYVNTVTYYVTYGDKVINVGYGYADGADLTEMEAILSTFEADLSKISFKTTNRVISEEHGVTVTNPLRDAYLTDSSYEYDGEEYFSASFGKKRDYNFSVTLYSNLYWDESYVGDFESFQKDTLSDAESWYDIVSSGELKVDGHEGFYFTDQYNDGFSDVTYYTTLYIDNGDTYLTVYYSGAGEAFKKGMFDFRAILGAVELSNEGEGLYLIPNLLGVARSGALNDITNYIYEADIKALHKDGVFGEGVSGAFNPEAAMKRGEFVKWAVLAGGNDVVAAFEDFKASYDGCGDSCYVDVNEDLEVYLEFAKSKGVIADRARFSPDEQISLMAAFKVVFELYGYEIWDAPDYVIWYVPYLHVGYLNGLMPYGVDQAGHELTRGEAAYILNGASLGS